MGAREFLEQYRREKAKEANLNREIKKLEERIGSSYKMDGLPKKGDPTHPTEEIALQLVEMKRKYYLQTINAISICDEVLQVINKVPDPRCIRLLHLYYCEGKPWYKIADILHYSEDYVAKELHIKALEMVEVILGE